jgi:hypothetical protein
MFVVLFDINRIVHKEFILAGQTVNFAYYSDLLWRLRENVRRLRPELWRQKKWLLHHDNALSRAFFLATESFYYKQHNVVPHPSYFSLLPRLKLKLKGRHFAINEVIETESQAELNTLTEHDFQDAF